MRKITFRQERNFYAKRPAQIAVMDAAIQAIDDVPLENQKWYCGECGHHVPVSQLKRESPDALTGICKCGKTVDQVPF